jgi:hypothetical protein
MDLTPQEKAAATALVAQCILFGLEGSSQDLGKADAAALTLTQWARGQNPDPNQMANIIYDENDEGVLRHEQETQGTTEHAFWLTLGQALMYGTWRAASDSGQKVPSEVSEVREEEFLELLGFWRAISSRNTLLDIAEKSLPDLGSFTNVVATLRS